MKIQAFAALLVTTATTSVSANPVEIMLTDRLDGKLDSYCLDISGSKKNADISKGLQTHTCYAYQGEMGIDQMFELNRLAENQLYMPEFDVCATAESLTPGAKIGLSTCDESSAPQITLTQRGTLSPVDAMDLCFTAGAETKFGRGGTSEHQIKSLTLETCSDELAPYQQWQTRG